MRFSWLVVDAVLPSPQPSYWVWGVWRVVHPVTQSGHLRLREEVDAR